LTRNRKQYEAIQEVCEENGASVQKCCAILHVSPSAYYSWRKTPLSLNELINKGICCHILRLHIKYPEAGYRMMADKLREECNIDISDKRCYRLFRKLHIHSQIKWRPKGCTHSRVGKNSPRKAENVLNRKFQADMPDQKWVTDVTEFRLNIPGPVSGTYIVEHLYLSAILDLYDHRIVSYAISDRNDTPLVMETFRKAFKQNPNAHPLVHTDQGFQYTSNEYLEMAEQHNLTRSMSRTGRCLDNAPMEGFWGMIKRERIYMHTYYSVEELEWDIRDYIQYYNTKRTQRKLMRMSPMAYHDFYANAA
jgi:transposase InsO family protein